MVTHKHVHHIVGVFVIVTCRDWVVFLVGIVIPLGSIAIPLYTLGLQAFEIIDTILSKCSIVLCKDGILDFTLFWYMERTLVTIARASSLVIQMIRFG